MTSEIKKNTRYIFDLLSGLAADLDMSIYVVGGYVRDFLLRHDGMDLDFVVVGDAIRFCQAFKKHHRIKSFVSYPRFGTCMLEYRKHKLEFVSARVESYEKSSRKPQVKKADLLSDLSRRDFTINAIAMDISKAGFGTLIDPYQGRDDLARGIIRTPRDPHQTFSDDPLRMMRAVRFANQFNFKIDSPTFGAVCEAAGRLSIISQERITAEFNKIMLSAKPSRGLLLLDKTGLLTEFFPEFEKTKGVEQREKFHHKDVFYHTLQVLDQIALVTDKLPLRLAALLHDIAKPKTKRFSKKSGWTFYGHEVVGEKMSALILHRLKYSKDVISFVKKIVRLHLRPMALVSEEVTDSAIRRLLFMAGEDFDDLMLLCRADITSKNPEKVKRYLKNYQLVIEKSREVEEKDKLRSFKSPVDGNEIMTLLKLKPGPQIGKIKKYIEDGILSGEIPNEHDAALAYLLAARDKLLNSAGGMME